jgi:AraC-like DNA-binding protein
VGGTVDKAALLRSVGLTRGEPADPADRIGDADYYAFLERAAAADPDATTLPLRAGAAMRCDEYGAFGLAWKSAPTLQASYDRAERFWQMLTSVSAYAVEPATNGAFMHLHRNGRRRLGMRLSNEATLASITAISREVATAAFCPVAVYFQHPAPASVAAHEAYFGCPVHFEADRDALLVSADTLQTPNKLGDSGLSRFFDAHLAREVEAFRTENAVERQVRDFVTRRLSDGAPALSDVARHLGMSSRTLQRRLAEQGHSYRTLVDASRRQLAKHLLRKSDFSLIEVAFMTGFADQSAFTRAFKRWSGHTPRAYRLGAATA